MLRLARSALPSRAPAATLSCLRNMTSGQVVKEEVSTKEEVVKFLGALKIDAKFADKADKLGDMSTMLSPITTQDLKKAGMTVKQRKKLLTHIDKYKEGLWTYAPIKKVSIGAPCALSQ
jgi:hypothetical protein